MTSGYQQHQMLSSEIINICHLKQLDIDIKSGIAAEWQEIILLLHMCYNNFFIEQIYSLQEVLILTYLTLVLSLDDGEVCP
jgi:hypothetical protein